MLTEHLARLGVSTSVNNLTKLLSMDAVRKGLALYRFLKRESIDVVVTYHHDADIWGGIIARLAGVPVLVASRRDMGYQLGFKHVLFYRYCHWLFSGFIAVSQAVKEIVAHRERVPSRKIHVIHNGLDPLLFQNSSKVGLREEFAIPEGATVVGMAASFRPVKGQMYLVNAAARVVETAPVVRFVLVGHNDTEYFRQVTARIAELGLEQYFIFPGNRTDIPALLKSFDIFVISSEQEGFSNAIIEAMAAGLPVVASRCGGNPEAVEDTMTGYLFPACDHRALAEALIKLVNNPELRRQFADNGREKVNRMFLLDNMVQKNEILYLQLLGR